MGRFLVIIKKGTGTIYNNVPFQKRYAAAKISSTSVWGHLAECFHRTHGEQPRMVDGRVPPWQE